MSAATVPVVPSHFRGHSSRYVDIAFREGELLSVSLDYAVHPSNVGCFIVRFVARGPSADPKNYKHLTYRETAKFLIPATDTTTAEVIKGLRLNKVALPAFKPAVQRYEVDGHALALFIWEPLAHWIETQATAEGFTLLFQPLDLITELRALVTPPQPKTEGVSSVFEVPDLAAPEHKAAALKLVQKPEPDEDEEDADEDDGDEDEKEWLN